MANQWLRLWHDMPTDPKWRTIARHAKQPISLVQAVYLHLLVDASRNVTRGHVTVTTEDLASALDCDDADIQAILDAMQGRVLDGQTLAGWEKRQPRREDSGDPETGAQSAAERKRAQREREKQQADATKSVECHDASRNVTTDKDKDKEEIEEANASVGSADRLPRCDTQSVVDLYHDTLPELPRVRLMTDGRRKAVSAFWRFALTSKKSDGSPRATDADEAMKWIGGYFARARDNDFLMGRGHKAPGHEGWQCDFDFLLTEKGKKHVIEKTKEAA